MKMMIIPILGRRRQASAAALIFPIQKLKQYIDEKESDQSEPLIGNENFYDIPPKKPNGFSGQNIGLPPPREVPIKRLPKIPEKISRAGTCWTSYQP
jgi:hypothetical protein